MIRIHPQDAYDLSKHVNNILTSGVLIKVVSRKSYVWMFRSIHFTDQYCFQCKDIL